MASGGWRDKTGPFADTFAALAAPHSALATPSPLPPCTNPPYNWDSVSDSDAVVSKFGAQYESTVRGRRCRSVCGRRHHRAGVLVHVCEVFQPLAAVLRIAYPDRPVALIGMSLRKVNPSIVAETKIMAVQAGLADITTNAIEGDYLAGGNIRRVVQALIVRTGCALISIGTRPPRLTWRAATCWKPCKRASIRRSSIVRIRAARAAPRSTASPRTEFNSRPAPA